MPDQRVETRRKIELFRVTIIRGATKYVENVSWRFFAAALVAGVMLIVITPPFEVPDEPGHFIRAYALSELQWRCLPQGRFAVVTVPASLQKVAIVLADDIPGHPDRKFRLADLQSAIRVPLGPATDLAAPCGGAALYTPVPYVAQAGAIAIGRIWILPSIVLLYLARFANTITSLALLLMACRMAPFFRSVIALVAMLPMALFLRSSCSPDAIILPLAALTFATGLRLAFASDPEDMRRYTRLFLIAAFTLVLTKAVYFPLPFIAFITSRARESRRLLCATTIVSAVAAVISLMTARIAYTPLRLDVSVDASRQIKYLASHPVSVARVVLTDYLVHAPRYVAHLIGRLGWLDTPLPAIVLLGFLTLLVFAACTDGDARVKLTLHQRAYGLALTGAVLLLVAISQYIIWTPVGANYVEGIQGRYFLPIAPAFLLIFYGGTVLKMKEAFLLISSGAMTVVSIVVLVRRFY